MIVYEGLGGFRRVWRRAVVAHMDWSSTLVMPAVQHTLETVGATASNPSIDS